MFMIKCNFHLVLLPAPAAQPRSCAAGAAEQMNTVKFPFLKMVSNAKLNEIKVNQMKSDRISIFENGLWLHVTFILCCCLRLRRSCADEHSQISIFENG